jgi:uncharacterized protein YegL
MAMHSRYRVVAGAVALAWFAAASAAHAQQPVRRWTDASGRSIAAALVAVSGTTVQLKGPDGRILQVDIGQLSPADQLYIRSVRSRLQPVAPTPTAVAPPAAGEPVMGGGGADFYGIPVTGGRLLFLLDCSGSMEGEKMKRLKYELTKIVNAFAFDPDPSVSGQRTAETRMLLLIGFSSDLDVYEIVSREKADRAIERLSAGGETAMRKAWLRSEGYTEKERIDAIYFLSDGEPTDGTSRQILDLVTKWVEKRGGAGIPVHTIAIGKDSELMKQIASATGGRYQLSE